MRMRRASSEGDSSNGLDLPTIDLPTYRTMDYGVMGKYFLLCRSLFYHRSIRWYAKLLVSNRCLDRGTAEPTLVISTRSQVWSVYSVFNYIVC